MAKANEMTKTAKSPALLGFFHESWTELKKVHSPTRQETIAMTGRVFLMVGIFAVVLGVIDYVVGTLLRFILT